MSKETKKNSNKIVKHKTYGSSPDLSEDEIVPCKTRKFNKTTGRKADFQCAADKNCETSGGYEVVDMDSAKNKQGVNELDVSADFKMIFNSFNSSVSKTLQTKKKRLENFTAGAVQLNETKVKELLFTQHKEREHLSEELKRNVGVMLEQWDMDLLQSKEMEEKMLNIVQKQIKCIRELRSSQQQRLAALRQTMASFSKEIQEQENKHKQHYDVLQTDLRRELTALQNKLLLETQKEEMANMQKSLQTMLFM